MRAEELLQNLYPYIGGNENVCHFQAMDDVLYIRLKDQGKADLNALRQFEDILSVELKRGKLQIQAKEFFESEDNKMSKKDYAARAGNIIDNVGGKDNIALCFHCVTRLRFELKDKSLVNENAISAIDGVVTIQWAGDQLQVVVGTDVEKYFTEIQKLLPESNIGKAVEENLDESSRKKEKKNIGMTILDYISSSVNPVIPILVGSGMTSVLAMILSSYFSSYVGEGIITILNGIYQAGLYFLPIYLAVSAARKLKCSEYIAAMMGGIMLLPDLMGVEGITVFGFTMPTYDYSSTIVPILITVFVLSYVEKFFKKIMPSFLTYVFTPTCTVLVMGFITLFITAPLGSYIGALLGKLISWLSGFGIISIPILAVCFPLLVMTGMHTAVLGPLLLTEVSTMGYTIFGSACLAYMPAMAGATLAVAVKTKNPQLKSLAASTGGTVLLAASEPALYGVLLRLKKPLLACMGASAIGGFLVGLFQIKRYSMGSFNIFTLVMFLGDDIWNFVMAIAVFVLSFVLAFVFSYLLGWNEADEVK